MIMEESGNIMTVEKQNIVTIYDYDMQVKGNIMTGERYVQSH